MTCAWSSIWPTASWSWPKASCSPKARRSEIAANEAVQAAYLGKAGMSGSALQAEGLHTFYGKSHILHGVGLEVREGEIVTLLGRNGAGKTTTLRSLMGLTPAARRRRAHFRP